jgi:cell division septal protein FtsQ
MKPVGGPWQARASRLVAALLLAFLAWAAYAIFDSPNFYVFDVLVEGNSVVSREEVYAAAGLEGMSIFWVNPEEVAERIETLPNVKAAHVTARLPARVSVAVEERRPEFIWQTGDARWWIDAEGAVVPPRAEVSDALTLVDTDAQPLSPGQRLDPTITQAADSLRRLLPELKVMQYSQATGISFKTREGWPVYLGRGEDMDAKLTVLVALRKDLLARGVAPEFIDLRFVDRPFYR